MARGQATLLLAVMLALIFAHDAETLTIQETDEWKACESKGCTHLDLSGRGLTGFVPAAIGTFNVQTL